MNYNTSHSNQSDKNIIKKKNQVICLWCNQISEIIWVHGHGQCSVCGYNIDECSRGELSCNQSKNENDKNQNCDNHHFS